MVKGEINVQVYIYSPVFYAFAASLVNYLSFIHPPLLFESLVSASFVMQTLSWRNLTILFKN